jgi:tRNA (cytidine/uridine-2'-O-)-methyltransferase
MFRIAFVEPRIPPNTGNAIRLAAATGCELHLVGPLAFDFSEARVRRAGLDYHDLASVTIHPDIEAAWQAWLPARVFAFTGKAGRIYSDVEYAPGDVLMFGTESTGLPESVLSDARVTEQVRLPMLPGLRSLNLSNAASIAVYEAWRQNDYPGSADTAGVFT